MDRAIPVWWHAYQAEMPSEAGDPELAFTVIPRMTYDGPSEFPGTVVGREVVYTLVERWDHRPSDAETDAVKLRWAKHVR